MKASFLYAAGLLTLGACRATDVARVDSSSLTCAVPGVRVSPTSVSLHPGDTLRATANIVDCPGPQRSHAFRWRVGDSTIASVVPNAGLITARAIGTTTVTAIALEDTTQYSSLILQVLR